MPHRVLRDQVQDLLAQGAQLLDVLPPKEYDYQHIAGAINIPLKKLTSETTASLDRRRPVVVYCSDFL
jgi:rhodanese-related sulfurtransferase